MRRYLMGFLFSVTLVAGLALHAGGSVAPSDQMAATSVPHSFHSAPPTEPLPPVLDPSRFLDNHAAFVAYRLASRIPETLYQIPCYCGCDSHQGHESLLDCFTGNHGTHCRICQKEAIFCFVQKKRGQSPGQIREAMEQGGLARFDLEKYTRRLYPKLRKSRE